MSSFKQFARDFEQKADSFTLYASSNDKALQFYHELFMEDFQEQEIQVKIWLLLMELIR